MKDLFGVETPESPVKARKTIDAINVDLFAGTAFADVRTPTQKEIERRQQSRLQESFIAVGQGTPMFDNEVIEERATFQQSFIQAAQGLSSHFHFVRVTG